MAVGGSVDVAVGTLIGVAVPDEKPVSVPVGEGVAGDGAAHLVKMIASWAGTVTVDAGAPVFSAGF